jgi:hypothetical protein
MEKWGRVSSPKAFASEAFNNSCNREVLGPWSVRKLGADGSAFATSFADPAFAQGYGEI